MFGNYDSWKLATPPEYEFMGPDPRDEAAAEAEDEWLLLDSLENPQPLDEDDLDEIPLPLEVM
ncbi:MAG TPA: hypothetical protein VIY86_06925 [Pirellulaceae bacterium]